jgi:O-antigen/teichoic acid export membrane protein
MPEDAPVTPRPPRAGSLRAVLVNMGWLLGGRGVAAVLSLLYIAVITRTLGLTGFGQFALIVGTAQTVTALVSFQTWQVIVRYGMGHLHEGRPNALARLVKACLALDVGAAIVGSLLALAAVALLGPKFGWDGDLQRDAILFSIVTLVAVRSTSIGILRLYDRFGIAALADTAMPVSRLAGALLALALLPTVEGFLTAWAAAELIAAAVFWGFAACTIRGLPWRASPLGWAAVRAENPDIVRLAGFTNASQSFHLTGKQVAVLLVGLFASPAAAGGFRLSHQLGQAMAKVGQLLARALFPELMRTRTLSADPAHFAQLLGRTVRIAAAGGAVILLILFLAGKPLLGLIAGEEFLPAYPLLLLLGTAAVIDLVGVGFEPALIAAGRAGTAFRIQLTVAVALIALLVGLLSAYDAIGGGFALLIGSLLGFVLMAGATLRAFRRGDPEVTASDAAILKGAGEDVDRPQELG